MSTEANRLAMATGIAEKVIAYLHTLDGLNPCLRRAPEDQLRDLQRDVTRIIADALPAAPARDGKAPWEALFEAGYVLDSTMPTGADACVTRRLHVGLKTGSGATWTEAARNLCTKLGLTIEAAEAGKAEWRPLFDDGFVACDEGETYLFAIPVSTNGAPPHWEYFVDAVVWDAETDPDWSNGEHGWGLLGEIQYRAIQSPPSAPEGT